MLIEIYERLRGYDKWVQTEAKIESSDVIDTPHAGRDGSVSHTWASSDGISWGDFHGVKHYSEFNADDESPLYQVVGGEKVTIRYNPANPSQFYFRDLLRSRLGHLARIARGAFLLLACLALLIALNWYTHQR